MDRETRANLIVIGVVVALLIPGAIIVIRKKMDPTIKPMGSPDYVRSGLVYIDPTPAPTSVPRLVPAATSAWTRSVARSLLPAFSDARASTDDRPVVSDRKLVEIVGWTRSGETLDVVVLVWDLPRGTKTATPTVTVNGSAAAVTTSAIRPLPPAVMKDLQLSGYPAPPQEVLGAVFRVAPPPDGPAEARVVIDADGKILQDTVSFDPR